MPEDNWLERRRTGIGGTDAPCILGINKYKGAYEVWAEKLGLVSKPIDNPSMRVGRLMEPVIAKWFADEYGIELEKPEMKRSETWDFMLASADYLIKGRADGLDCKLSLSPHRAREWGFDGTDEIPSEYWVQGQHYLLVYGYQRWIFPAVLNDGELHTYVVVPDVEFHQLLLEECEAFWKNHILTGEPPTPGATSLCREYVTTRYCDESEKLIDIEDSADARQIVEALRAVRQAYKMIALEREAVENTVREIIGNDGGLFWGKTISNKSGKPDEYITWKRTKGSTKIDYEAIVSELCKEAAERGPKSVDMMKALIAKHTKDVPGHRRLYAKFEESENGAVPTDWRDAFKRFNAMRQRTKFLGAS